MKNVNTTLLSQASQPVPNERWLVRQAKSGDSQAFASIYDAYVERVYRYIYFRITDDATAEDLTSQVFLKAWENLHRYESSGTPYLAWLYTIARNLVIDHYRTQKNTVSIDDAIHLAAQGPSLDDEVQGRFEIQEMRDALQFLTDEQQQVLILRFISGLSTEHVAEIMNKRQGAIRALQMRALQNLSKRLEEKEVR
jgi:RNA polymerase sigma-70 factor (ECF subfamily)